MPFNEPAIGTTGLLGVDNTRESIKLAHRGQVLKINRITVEWVVKYLITKPGFKIVYLFW